MVFFILSEMKNYFSFLYLFLFGGACYNGQTVVSFQNLASQHIRLQQLDSIYISALHQDTGKSVFNHQAEQFISCYTSLVQELGRFQKNNGLTLDQPLKYFHRLYFNTKGQLEFYLYNFPPNRVTPQQETVFIKNCMLFFKTYRFPISASAPFAQCCKVQLN